MGVKLSVWECRDSPPRSLAPRNSICLVDAMSGYRGSSEGLPSAGETSVICLSVCRYFCCTRVFNHKSQVCLGSRIRSSGWDVYPLVAIGIIRG